MIKAVIFDFDGVIVNSEPIHKAFEQKVFGQLGLDISEEEHESFTGSTWGVMCEKIKKKHNPPVSFEEFLKIFLDNKPMIYENVPAQEGMQKTVESLSKEFKLAIASSAETDTIKKTLERLGVSKFFGFVQGSENITNPKPDPEVFLKAAEGIGVKPEMCAVVEDAELGVKAANAAGMKPIGFQGNSRQNLSEARAVVRSLGDITPSFLASL
jgi:HAD superfamily hydrolase (TIGR01509 family)